MQNTEHIKDERKKKASLWKRILEKIKEKDERELRRRLKSVVTFILTVVVTCLAGGAELFFGTYPIALALACSTGSFLLPVSVGALILTVAGRLPITYAVSYVAIILMRVLAVMLPIAIGELKGNKETRALIVRPTTEVVRSRRGRGLDNIIPAGNNAPYTSDIRHASADGDVAARKNEKSGEENSARTLFFEEIHIKLICAAIGGFLCGFFLLIERSFSFYSLCATLVLTVACPIATLLLGGVFGEKRYIREWYTLLSVAAIAALCVWGAKERVIIGMPMAPFLSMLITLYFCSERGMLAGLAASLLCGLTFNVLYIPLLALSALAFCLISAVKRNAGLAVVCALVVLWCYYIGGSEGLVSVLPPMLLSIPVYMAVDKYREMMHSPYNKSAVLAGGVYFAEAVTEKTKNEAVRERLGALSEAFASLSDTFYKLSDRFRRPDMLGIKQITESVFESGCEGCRNRDLCWGAQYSDTLEAVRCITAQLHTKGVADASCLPDSFSQRCVRREGILGEVNARLSEMTEKIIKGERVGFFASNYDDITAILKDALSADGDEYESDSEAGRKIFDYLYDQGFHLNGVVVYGKRCRHVVVKGVSLSDKMSGKKSAQICKKLGEIVGVPLTDPVLEVGRDGAVMLLNSKPQYRARCAHGRLPAEKSRGTEEQARDDELYVDPFYNTGEELCGDATNAFITDSSYFYSLISDGMGSGAEAAFTSGVCSMFIEKMLCAGNKADITLRMLNNVIRSENMGCGSENSATVDLFELDLIDGSAAFLKSGAAPTYVARGETIYKINSRTMPVGIINDADARVTKFDTERGDIIVMISDGCCPDSDDCPWLVEYLCRYASEREKVKDVSDDESESLKNMLLTLAIKNYPRDRERDDISVSVIIIE